MDQSQIERSIARHGKITVRVKRGLARPPSTASEPILWNGYDAPDTESSSKSVVKDNQISHAIR